MVLAGMEPVFIAPNYDDARDLVHGICVKDVDQIFRTESPTDLAAVVLVSPTYHGVLSNVQEIARICHMNNVPLIVDEAHGAHLNFHEGLPESAIHCGADIVIQSTHKTLSAMTQASMLHVNIAHGLIDSKCVARALRSIQSTSPSNLLLASLDSARQQMQDHGHILLARSILLANRLKQAVEAIPGFSVLEQQDLSPEFKLDPTRVTILIENSLGTPGYTLDELLINAGIYVELPSLRHLTLIISHGNSEQDVDSLVNILRKISSMYHGLATQVSSSFSWPSSLILPSKDLKSMAPRLAFFALREVVPLREAVGRISASTICPYPPGIPAVFIGEHFSPESIKLLKDIAELGGTITGAVDDQATMVEVVVQ